MHRFLTSFIRDQSFKGGNHHLVEMIKEILGTLELFHKVFDMARLKSGLMKYNVLIRVYQIAKEITKNISKKIEQRLIDASSLIVCNRIGAGQTWPQWRDSCQNNQDSAQSPLLQEMMNEESNIEIVQRALNFLNDCLGERGSYEVSCELHKTNYFELVEAVLADQNGAY